MPRESGASSNLLNLLRLLDRPPSRAMTGEECAANSSRSVSALGARGRYFTAPPRNGIDCTMVFALPPRRAVFDVAETLAIALSGGVIFAWFGLPAGLVS